MKLYKYSAQDEDGQIIKGVFEAEDISEFYRELGSQNLFCLHYVEDEIVPTKIKTIYKLKIKDLVLFSRKLSTMLGSGMSITNSIDIMCNSVDNPKLLKIYSNIYESIRGGNALSTAMRENGDAFPVLLINMIESGEESGNIELMCTKLAVYYEKQAKIASKIKTATIYPKILGILSISVVMILFTFVLPSIFETFAGMELPLITVIMMKASYFFVHYWYLVVALIVLIFIAVKTINEMPAARKAIDKMIIKTPKVGKLLVKIYAARFASTLAILYSSGLSLLNGIRLSVGVVGNKYIEEKLTVVMEKVSLGSSLSDSLIREQAFDSLLPSMIKIGEETGSLDSILNSVADYYDQETETSIDGLLGIMEPVLLIFLAIIIGSVLIAVMLPIFTGYGTIG
ncbi:MAG: type II secretion system F family protein [Clostridiales bacterium]